MKKLSHTRNQTLVAGVRSGMKAIFALAAFALLVSACSGEAVTMEANATEQSVALSDTTVPQTAVPIVETTVASTEPIDDVQPWPIGPEFAASEFELNGETRLRSIWLISFQAGSFDVSFESCLFGGHAEFEIDGERLLIDDVSHMEDIGCPDEPADLTADGQALEDLFLSEPKIEVTVDSIILESETTRLVLTTDDPTDNQPVAPTDVWFRGIASTDVMINPERVSVIVRAFFVIEFKLETCSLHAQAGALQQVDRRDIISGFDPTNCPNPSESDQAAMDLLNSEPVLLYANEQLTITGADGTIITLE